MLDQSLNAIVLASVYALFGLGFNLVLGALNILNVAHAAVFGAGAYAAYWLTTDLGLPFALAAVLALVIAGVLSVLVNEIALGPLRRRGGGGLTPLIASLGAAMIILTALQLASSARILRLPADSLPDFSLHIAGARLSLEGIIAVSSSLALVGATYYLLHRTDLGKAIRATEFDENIARMVGIPTERVVRSTFFLSGVLAGAGGVVTALLFNSVHFRMGEPYLLKGFVVVVLGGFGSVGGTILASVILAFAEVSAVATGIASWRDALAFGLLIAILLIRPSGLFRSPDRARA